MIVFVAIYKHVLKFSQFKETFVVNNKIVLINHKFLVTYTIFVAKNSSEDINPF